MELDGWRNACGEEGKQPEQRIGSLASFLDLRSSSARLNLSPARNDLHSHMGVRARVKPETTARPTAVTQTGLVRVQLCAEWP